MTDEGKQRTVFISYSWTSQEHEDWVESLATRLAHNGVLVKFDKWDLRGGHDKFAFMEHMVTSQEIDKVLLICDSGYKKKADSRSGGVGTETQIITPELYGQTQQEKFIPIIAERDERGNEIMPAFIAARMYIDLSSPDSYEENFETLLRTIYQAPAKTRPPLGRPPAYLFNQDTARFRTSIVIRKMETAGEKDSKRLKYLWSEFSDELFESFDSLRIAAVPDPQLLDEQIIEKIESALPLHYDFIRATELICEHEQADSDHFISLIEKLFALTEDSGNFYEDQFDHFKFFLMETLVTVIAVLLKYKRYDLITDLLYSDYYVETRYSERTRDYSGLRFFLKSLDTRNRRLRLSRISIHADTLHQRIPAKYREEFLTADLLLYYVSRVRDPEGWGWFPHSYIYLQDQDVLRLFSRLKSKRHFEATKMLYQAKNISEMKETVQSLVSKRGYPEAFKLIPGMSRFIDPDEICTQP